jgi:hypothetical protein
MFELASLPKSLDAAQDHAVAPPGAGRAHAAAERADGAPALAGRARRRLGRSARALAVLALCCAGALAPAAAGASPHPFLSFKHNTTVGSTVPANGDQNPYGIVTVQHSAGALHAGATLISNFNNAGSPPLGNLQGTGSTIVELTAHGRLSLFARINPATLPGACPGGVGLTTALAVLPQGYVVVGSLPTMNGSAATAQAGCLIMLDSHGHAVETIAGAPINGPWDMTAVSTGSNSTLFVSNVLNGTVASGETPVPLGTVVRIRLHGGRHTPPRVSSMQVIATGFPERTDPAALIVGPTGVALGAKGTLYVADTQGKRIAAVPNALGRRTPLGGGGATVAAGGFLNGPLGLTIAPNGDILTANAADGNIVETTTAGLERRAFDTGAGGGGLFGLAVAPNLRGLLYVDDANNTLGLLH